MDKNFLYTGDESTHEETVYEKDFKITSKYTTYLEKNLRRICCLNDKHNVNGTVIRTNCFYRSKLTRKRKRLDY